MKYLAGHSLPRSTYMGSVHNCLHPDGSRGLDLGGDSGRWTFAARRAPLSHSERGLRSHGLGLPLVRLDFVKHGLVGLVFALLGRVVCFLCLMVDLRRLPLDVFVDHGNWNITTRKLMASCVGSARGLGGNRWRIRSSRRLRLPWKQNPLLNVNSLVLTVLFHFQREKEEMDLETGLMFPAKDPLPCFFGQGPHQTNHRSCERASL